MRRVNVFALLVLSLVAVLFTACSNNVGTGRVPTVYATSNSDPMMREVFRPTCTNVATGGGWFYCADEYRREYNFRNEVLTGTEFESLVDHDVHVEIEECLVPLWRGM